MLTPQEIREVGFAKFLGGYKTKDVDDFADNMITEYEKLYAENKKLVQSLQVLADRVEEYRKEEDKIKTTLLQAQKMSESLVREAKHKAELDIKAAEIKGEKIMEEATVKADRIIRTAEQNVKKEEEGFLALQKEVSSFKERLLTIYKEHITLITALPDEEETAEESVSEEEAAQPSEEVPEAEEENVAPEAPVEEAPATLAEAVNLANGNPEAESAEEEAQPFEVQMDSINELIADLPEKSNFEDLQFGEEYDLNLDGKSKGLFNRKK